MLRRTNSNLSDDAKDAKVVEEAMNIELQATDSSGSSSYEAEDNYNTSTEPQKTNVDPEPPQITEGFPTTTTTPPTTMTLHRRSLSMR